MSAIEVTCKNCKAQYITGMVMSTPWLSHTCPDGTKNAPVIFGWEKK